MGLFIKTESEKRRALWLCGASGLAMGLSTGLGLLAAPAMAQVEQTQAEEDEDDAATSEEEDVVVVTGIRQSLQSAQNIKRNSDQLVDAVTAVDIGRLPDVNVAEALQRISGIQITRNYGEGSGIAVRGLTKVRSELNGRDIFTASGGRGLSWEEVGSDLLYAVEVYKNPSAEMIEGGLGGTINLRTRLPFDSNGRVVSASANTTYYELADDYGYGLSGLFSDRWETGAGEFGALLNVSYGETSFRQDKIVMEPYYVSTTAPGYEGQEIAIPNGGGIAVGVGDRERTSVAAALQWAPTPDLEFTLQGLRTDYTFSDNGLSYFAYGQGADLVVDPSVPLEVENGIAISGGLVNPAVDAVTFGSTRDTYTQDLAFKTVWQATPNLQLSGDIQYLDSQVEQKTMNLTASALNPRNGLQPQFDQNWTFLFDTTPEIYEFGSSPNGFLADIENYGHTAVLPYAELNDAESWASRADLVWEFDDSFIRDFRAGIRHTDRTAVNRTTTYGTWAAIGQSCANWSGNCIPLSDAPADTAELFPFRDDFLYGDGSDVFGSDIWMWGFDAVRDPEGVFDLLAGAPYNQPTSFRDFDDPAAQHSTIDETTLAGYGVIRFGRDDLATPFDGNFGIRVVKTETEATGFQTLTYRYPVDYTPGDPIDDPNCSAGDGAVPTCTIAGDVTGGNEYTNVLPSLNMKFNLSENLLLRFAAAKNLSRPTFLQLNPQGTFSPNYTDASQRLPDQIDGDFIGSATVNGNPDLDPEKTTQYDIALEWYFDDVGYIYGTYFNKTISDLLATQSDIEPYDVPGVGTVNMNVQRLVNVDEGDLEGFEIGGQYFPDFLPGVLDGFGVQANYTFIDSNAQTIAANAQTGGDQITVPIQGLSNNSYNLILLYENYDINARLAYNWRDDYLQGTNNVGTGELPIFGAPVGYLDASISYDINDNVAITLDAQNLTKEEFRTYQITDARFRDYTLDDRRVSARVRFRF